MYMAETQTDDGNPMHISVDLQDLTDALPCTVLQDLHELALGGGWMGAGLGVGVCSSPQRP